VHNDQYSTAVINQPGEPEVQRLHLALVRGGRVRVFKEELIKPNSEKTIRNQVWFGGKKEKGRNQVFPGDQEGTGPVGFIGAGFSIWLVTQDFKAGYNDTCLRRLQPKPVVLSHTQPLSS